MATDVSSLPPVASPFGDALKRPRNPWLAALLSLVGSFLGGAPIGQVYAGAARRAVILWVIQILLLPVMIVAAMWLPSGRVAIALMGALVLGYLLFVVIDAYRVAARRREEPLKPYQRWWVYLLLIVCLCLVNPAIAQILAYTIKRHFIEAFVIPTRGMSDTILAGDKILVDKRYYRSHPVQRGDVIVFFSEGPGSPPFVMRVVGTAGDRIEMRGEKVTLNDKPLDEPYVKIEGPIPPMDEFRHFRPVEVSPDSVFVLGDHRRLSKDSRFFGDIPLRDVIGKVRFIYFSREVIESMPSFLGPPVPGSIRWERIGQSVE
ncbi:MAG TPA: signal peptidase I [Thermoguttaceae bacterium]|nr:signal peptidase I [Thermoguttaceae bacterium]